MFPVYTTRQRNFALFVTGVIFTLEYFNFGLNTTDLRQSHFRNLSGLALVYLAKIDRIFTFRD